MDYLIVEDIESVMAILEMTQDKFAADFGVSRVTLNNWLSGRKGISKRNVSIFYESVFDKGIRLNKIKEQFYREELKSSNEILLFHGSKTEIVGEISLEHNKRINDLGNGFYCGTSLEQSSMFVASYQDPSLYMIKFDRKGLRSLELDVDTDWMLMVAFYRGRLDKYKDCDVVQNLIDKHDSADYIIAPIADNRMYEIIDSFIDGQITDVQCRHCLAATDLGKQYVMLTENAISNLTILERCYLTEAEKRQYIMSKNESYRVNRDKVKLAQRQYMEQGLYIEEILT